MTQEADRPDAILQAANMVSRERWHDLLLLSFPDTPFQLDRAIARAFTLVDSRVSVISEDSEGIVMQFPDNTRDLFFKSLSYVKRTSEGKIAEALSCAYRFNRFVWNGSLPAEEYLYDLGVESKKDEPSAEFAKLAARRVGQDMLEMRGLHPVDMELIREWTDPESGIGLSYEGYLAVLKRKIEEILEGPSLLQATVD